MALYFQKHYNNTTPIINEDLKIPIWILRDGTRKTSHGGTIYYKKACTVEIIDKIIKYAKYNNYKSRKSTDKAYVIGFLNFKAKIKIDNKIENIRLAVQFRKDGKMYYSIEINKKRG